MIEKNLDKSGFELRVICEYVIKKMETDDEIKGKAFLSQQRRLFLDCRCMAWYNRIGKTGFVVINP